RTSCSSAKGIRHIGIALRRERDLRIDIVGSAVHADAERQLGPFLEQGRDLLGRFLGRLNAHLTLRLALARLLLIVEVRELYFDLTRDQLLEHFGDLINAE